MNREWYLLDAALWSAMALAAVGTVVSADRTFLLALTFCLLVAGYLALYRLHIRLHRTRKERDQAVLMLEEMRRSRAAGAVRVTTEDTRVTSPVHEAYERLLRRISDDLNDRLAQSLSGLLFELEAMAEHESRSVGRAVLRAIEITELAIDELRAIDRDVHPPVLHHWGLAAALREYVAALRERTELSVVLDLSHDASGDALPAPMVLAAYRVMQEALRNAEIHAAASEIRVVYAEDGCLLHLSVEDNGVGFALADTPRAGIAMMQERAVLAGGSLTATSTPGLGTRVVLDIPLALDGSGATEPEPRLRAV